jgi:hypothetical protein
MVSRFVLALLAVIGLLTSPVAASAACGGHGGAAMQMAMADMPGMVQANTGKADPCCDPNKGHAPNQHSNADCAQVCAAMCGVIAALPSAPVAFLAPPDREAPLQARAASLKPHEPSRLERPPKSIA